MELKGVFMKTGCTKLSKIAVRDWEKGYEEVLRVKGKYVYKRSFWEDVSLKGVLYK